MSGLNWLQPHADGFWNWLSQQSWSPATIVEVVRVGPIGSAVRASASKHLSLPSPPRLRCSAAARKLARLRERRCAFVMLQATHDVRNVTLWLGHADIRTTEVYLRMDLSEKRSRCRSAGTETGPLQGTRRTDRVFARGYAGVASKESASCLRMRCSMLKAV